MFDQESDEPFVRAERRAMNAQWRFFGIIFVAIFQAERRGHGEVHLATSIARKVLNSILFPRLNNGIWNYRPAFQIP